MRRKETRGINNIIQESLKNLNIDQKVAESHLINHWKKIVGKTIQKYTENVYISNNKLYVHLNSSVVRNELYMIKDELKHSLNEEAGKEAITDIIIR